MKKIIATAIAAFFVVGVVSAQHPHINKKDQANAEVAYDEVEGVCFTGVVAGNGNASSVDAYLIVEIEADTYCRNPAGGAKDDIGVPGHMDYTITGDVQTFDCKNGKASIHVCADVPGPDCPNPQWTGWVENVFIKSAVLVINGIPLNVSRYINN